MKKAIKKTQGHICQTQAKNLNVNVGKLLLRSDIFKLQCSKLCFLLKVVCTNVVIWLSLKHKIVMVHTIFYCRSNVYIQLLSYSSEGFLYFLFGFVLFVFLPL